MSPEQSTNTANSDYLKMIASFSAENRKQIFDGMDVTDHHNYPDRIAHSYPELKPLVERILRATKTEDPLVETAFGEFMKDMTPFREPIKQLDLSQVSRAYTEKQSAPETAAALADFARPFDRALAIEDVHERVAAINDAYWHAPGVLDANPSLDFHKAVYNWGENHPDDGVRSSIERYFHPNRQTGRLTHNIFEHLSKMRAAGEVSSIISLEAPFNFDRRAGEQQLSTEQVINTKQNILQLLQIADRYRDNKGELTRVGEHFQRAAVQTLNQAADPLLVTQGNHPTCAMASLELALYSRNPDEASRIVNQILRTGKIKTIDGTTISIDPNSLRPEKGSLEPNRPEWDYEANHESYRSYASQVLQTTMANIYWQRQTVTPDGEIVPRGSIRYIMHTYDLRNEAGRKTGEETSDYLIHGPLKNARILAEDPHIMTLEELLDIGNQIAGERTTPSVIDSGSPMLADEETFRNYVSSLQYPQQFPLIIGIDATAMVNGAKENISPNHAVSILAPWQPGGNIFFHNTWRPGSTVSNYLPTERFFELAPRWIP
jgi:hypothetical protein